MPTLQIPAFGILQNLGTRLTLKPLNNYYFQYIYRDIARPIIKQILDNHVQVSCWATWNDRQQRWEGNVNYQGESYLWIIRE